MERTSVEAKSFPTLERPSFAARTGCMNFAAYFAAIDGWPKEEF